MSEGERHWAAFRRECDDDPGSLREIWLTSATVDDWDRVLQVVRERYAFRFLIDGEPAAMPSDARAFFARADPHAACLRIHVADGVTVNTHFFEPTTIELDVAPREIASPAALEAVFVLMRDLATALDRDVIMTAEATEPVLPEMFRAYPSRRELTYVPPPHAAE